MTRKLIDILALALLIAACAYAYGYWYQGQQQDIAQWETIQATYGPEVAHNIYLSIKR